LKNFQKIIDEVGDFPTLPTIYTSLLNVMADPRSSVNDVARIVTQDIAASTKILKTVNSSVYSLATKIDTITQAIFHLGFNEVKNLVIGLSVMDMFSESSSLPTFNILDLWKHSIGVGVIARIIGTEIGIKNVENYFLSGLIHDIGKLFFLERLNSEYSEVIRIVEDKSFIIEQAEKEVLGLTHCEAGELLAKKWGLPQSIINSIRYHSTGFIGNEANLQVATIHLANVIARVLEFGFGGDKFIPRVNSAIWNVMKIEEGLLSTLLSKFNRGYSQSISILLKTN